ncbi:MAG: hypothetical protein NTX76_00700 [Alphaproteobacteria bacterium]|nr:hypothetical protein [Alphaproteobacteria bacterium]
MNFKCDAKEAYAFGDLYYKYQTSKDHIFLSAGNTIIMLNKHDGSIIKSFSIGGDGKLKSMHYNPNGLLFTAIKVGRSTKILGLNIDTLETKFNVVDSPKKGMGLFHPAGRFFLTGADASSKLSVYDENGLEKIVETSHLPEDADKRFPDEKRPPFSTYENFLHYQEVLADGTSRSVKYDMDSGSVVSTSAVPFFSAIGSLSSNKMA